MSDLPAQPTVDRRDRTPAEAALRLIDAGRADDAVALLARFLAEQPTDVTAMGLLSLAHLRAHRWTEALTAADAALGLAPDHLPAWQRRAIALLELNRTEDALVATTEYLRLAPDDWHAHYTKARALRDVRGRRQEALRHALRAVELAPDDADAHNLLGVIHRGLEDRVAAERAYRAALAIDPTHALARSNLALLTLGRAGTGEVMAGLRAAAASDPHQRAIHRNMALVAVLALVRRGTWLALADLLAVWVVLADGSVSGPVRWIVFGLVVAGWAVLVAWWLGGLRPYLRSLLPGAFGRLLRSSDARWGLAGVTLAALCAVAALLVPAAGLVLVLAGYVVQLAGSGLSRRLAIQHRTRAARDVD